jgi:Flp pilus assembly protein TadD
LATATACLAAAALAVPGVAARSTTLASPTEGTAGGRLELWQAGLSAVVERPLLGWGPDMSRPAIERNLPEGFEARFGDARVEDRVHNALLDIAVWGGLVAVALLLVAIAAAARQARPAWRAPDGGGLALGCGLIAFGCHWMFNFPDPVLDPLVAVFAGALVGIPAGTRAPTRVLRLPSVIGGCATVAVATVAVLAGSDALAADRSARVAVDTEATGDLAGAERSYLDAYETSGRSARYAEMLARFYVRAGRPDTAIAPAARASERDPADPYLAELHASVLAAAALQSGDVAAAAAAESIVRPLATAAPEDGSLQLVLGTALAAQGKASDAQAAYERSAQLLPHRSEPLRNLAILAEGSGDLTRAADLLRRALAVNPDDAVAAAALARVEAAR